MSENKSYYAVIPANVRYDERLKPNEKLLYGEITALCNQQGFCWASNKYFADLYKTRKETISRYISSLEMAGYITINIMYKEGTKMIDKRCISLSYPIDEKVMTYCANNQDPIDEKVKENNTSINTTTNNKEIYKEKVESMFDDLWKLYPKKLGKGRVSFTTKKKLYEIGIEEMTRCINRYKQDTKDTEQQFIQNGSTFFNSGYVDYLDENYTSNLPPIKSIEERLPKDFDKLDKDLQEGTYYHFKKEYERELKEREEV